MKEVYKSISEIIEILHQHGIPYLILRNYDNLLEKDMYMDGHGDVDMLVGNSDEVKNVLGAQTFASHGDDGTHYYVMIDGQRVSLDLRSVGDGYYCRKWQQELLERRVLHNGFYVMCPEDYFYSLIYHAVLQKPYLSDDYKRRLVVMAEGLGVDVSMDSDIKVFIKLLETYMRKHGYTYTYAQDIFVPLHTKYISKDLLEANKKLAWLHWKFELKVSIISFAVKCKHLFTTGKYE